MPGLHDLLEDAASDAPGSDLAIEPSADVRRGRRALARRRTRWAAGATGGLLVAGAVGYNAIPVDHPSVAVPQPADGGPSPAPTPFYDVPPPPAGWHLVGERAEYVMLTRDGSGVTSVDSGFVGQIVIGLQDGSDPFQTQPSMQYDGRTFYVNTTGGADMTTLSVRSRGGDWLQAEYPQAAFDVNTMIAYLDGVVVKDGAQPAHG